MKIILISKVVNLGNIGDVVNVKDGYGKNFLIPQNKAIFYSPANYKIFEEKKQQFEEENNQKTAKAQENKKKLSGKDIIIIGNASDDGRLYGSVTTAIIAGKINDIIGEKLVSRIDVILSKPIKDIGVYDVKVNLYSDIFADVRLIVSRSESEIKALLAAHKEEQEKAKEEAKKDKKAEVKEESKEEVAAETQEESKEEAAIEAKEDREEKSEVKQEESK